MFNRINFLLLLSNECENKIFIMRRQIYSISFIERSHVLFLNYKCMRMHFKRTDDNKEVCTQCANNITSLLRRSICTTIFFLNYLFEIFNWNFIIRSWLTTFFFRFDEEDKMQIFSQHQMNLYPIKPVKNAILEIISSIAKT